MAPAGLPVLNLFYRLAPAVTAWASARVADLPLTARVRPENLASRRVALHRAEHLDGEGCDGFAPIFASRLP
ncbi:acetyltransferase [Kitasatospora sp. NPDC058444]|uniref:acetyltransferase n=1 Tax=Kitasatospora sp. NPDC058444 TaxID=3346504 RepID=UPI00364ABEF0